MNTRMTLAEWLVLGCCIWPILYFYQGGMRAPAGGPPAVTPMVLGGAAVVAGGAWVISRMQSRVSRFWPIAYGLVWYGITLVYVYITNGGIR